MHEAIRRCGCYSQHFVYDNLGHGDFVIDWQVGPTLGYQLMLLFASLPSSLQSHTDDRKQSSAASISACLFILSTRVL